MRASCVLAAALCVIGATEAFVFSPTADIRCRSTRRQQTHEVAAESDVEKGESGGVSESGTGRKWDGKSMPAKSTKFQSIPLDARNWEVQDDRDEVWDDMPNPVQDLEWYKNFEPSQEEIEAAEAGFDWTDEWFEAAGITPDAPADNASE